MLTRIKVLRACGSAVALCILGANASAAAGTIAIQESLTSFTLTGGKVLGLTNAALGDAAPFTVAGQTVSFVGLNSGEGVVTGSSPGLYTAPDTDPAGDAYTKKYLSTGDNGYINIKFSSSRDVLALLWGSVGLTNQIAFLEGNQVVSFITGADIEADETGSDNGSEYVKLTSSVNFNDIQISSGLDSFEAAEFQSADPSSTPVHEPASLALFGVGLLGLATIRRRA
jgi:hypothetical protein